MPTNCTNKYCGWFGFKSLLDHEALRIGWSFSQPNVIYLGFFLSLQSSVSSCQSCNEDKMGRAMYTPLSSLEEGQLENVVEMYGSDLILVWLFSQLNLHFGGNAEGAFFERVSLECEFDFLKQGRASCFLYLQIREHRAFPVIVKYQNGFKNPILSCKGAHNC